MTDINKLNFEPIIEELKVGKCELINKELMEISNSEEHGDAILKGQVFIGLIRHLFGLAEMSERYQVFISSVQFDPKIHKTYEVYYHNTGREEEKLHYYLEVKEKSDKL